MAGTALTICGRGGEQCQSCSGTGVCGSGVCAAPPDAGLKPDGGAPDAGIPPDAGTLPDAGSPPDAGTLPDAGEPDGGSGDSGVVDAGGPSGTGCSAPIPLKVVDGGAFVVGDTSGHEDLGAGPCGGAGGGDVVYELQLPPRSGNMVVTVEPLSSGGLQPVVYMNTLCDTPKYCVAAGTERATATLVSPTPTGGKYYLWVDGAPGSAGPYSLRVASFKDLGESCGAPMDLPFGAGEANISVSETSWVHDTRGSCEAWTNSGDHVYRLTVDRPQNLEVHTSARFFLGNTYLRSVCGGGELACTSGGELRRQQLTPGTYYLWRDTPGDAYDLYAHLSDPLPGDSCSTARPLVFPDGEEGGAVTERATTVGMFDDDLSGCGTVGAPDLVYTFTTSKTLDFRASAADHWLTLRNATCSGTQLACGTDNLAVGALPPGTYYLWLDNRSSTGNPFTLSASLTPASPGDTCASPEPLVFSGGTLGGDAEARGTLSTRFHNSSGSCGGAGNDQVYSFTTSTPLNFRASSSAGYVYLRSGDCSSGTELACGYYSEIEATGLAAGTYHLWVDSTSGGTSSYTLRAALTPPLCQAPIPLVFKSGDDGGTALVAATSGDTSRAFSTTQGSCGGSGGRDVVYSFDLTEPRRLDATVTSNVSGFRPALYLRASCDADELACVVAPPVSDDAVLSTGPLPPGKYYLWVDGFTGSAGSYSLTATLN